MKKLFFLLVVVNLVIWLWGLREQAGRVAETAEPGVGVIRLLDEAEVAARRELAGRPPGAPEPVASGAGTSERHAGPAMVEGPTAPEPQPAVAAAAVAPQAGGNASQIDRAPATPERAPAVPAEAGVAASGQIATPPAYEAAATRAAQMSARTAPLPASGVESAASLAQAGVAAEAAASPSSEAPPPDELSPTTAASATLLATEASVASPARPDEPALPHAAMQDIGSGIATGSAREAVEEPVAAERRAPEPPVATAAPAAVADSAAASGMAAPAPTEPPGVAMGQAPMAVPADGEKPAAAAREVTYVCESIGPFADRAAALGAQGGIVAPLRAAALREERPARQTRHWVLAPVQPSKEATADYLTRLGQAGVRDAWRIPNGPLAGRLAVGVFQSLGNARKHADMLAAKGVAAEVHAPKDLEPNRIYWVDYERPADVAPPDLGGGRSQPALRIVGRTCGRVAGPRALP